MNTSKNQFVFLQSVKSSSVWEYSQYRSRAISTTVVFVLLFFATLIANAQSGVGIGDSKFTAHSSAILELRTADKGFLVPRLTTDERNALSAQAANGLLVYDKETKSFWYRDTVAGEWRSITSTNIRLGNKHQILGINKTGTDFEYKTLNGFENQVIIDTTTTAGSIVIKLPQEIHTGASPQFAGATITGLTPNNGIYTDASKKLTSIPPSIGVLGFWNRTGTALSPSNVGDAITTSGNISTTGTGTITSAGLITGNAGVTVIGGAVNINSNTINIGDNAADVITIQGATTLNGGDVTIATNLTLATGAKVNDIANTLDATGDHTTLPTEKAVRDAITGISVNNGLENNSGTVQLGGDLIKATTIGVKTGTSLTINNDAGATALSIAPDGNITAGNGTITTGNGQVTFGGNLKVNTGVDITNADLTVGGTKFTVDDASGNTSIAGTLNVNGTSTLGVATATSINGLVPTELASGYTIEGGSTDSYTLTVAGTSTISGSNTGDQTTVTGNAGSATTTAITNDVASNATFYPTFVSANTGNLAQTVSDSKLTFNPSTGVLASTSFSGSLTGDVTGNVSGTSANVTGIVLGANGGTGVANTGKTITLAGNLVTAGGFSTTLTTTTASNVTLPTTGTLATLAGTETLTGKTLTSPKINEDVVLTSTATELNYVDGVTSGIQGQLDNKAAKGANTDITSVLLNQTGLVVKGDDDNALTIKPDETLTAGRTLNIRTGNSDRILTLTGDASISGSNNGDQSSIVGISGTLAQFNTALSDAEFARTDAAQTFTGIQSFTSPDVTTSLTTPSASFDLINATATTVNFAGAATILNVANAATTLNIGNTSTAAQTVNLFGGATVSGSNKTINIGTGGVAGSTTVIDIGSSAGTQNVNIANGIGGGTVNIATDATATKTINIGTGAVANTISIGGTGANTIAIGNFQIAGTISIGSAMTSNDISIGGSGTSSLTLKAGSGGVIVPDDVMLDLSQINNSDNAEGLRLPQSSDNSAATAEGQIAWDTDDDVLSVGTGGAIRRVGFPNGMQAFTDSGTWTKPAGVKYAWVKVWGAGGGGGTASSTRSNGGGGGGAYSESLVDVSSVFTCAVVVGAAGPGETTTPGGASSFTAGSFVVFANGGESVNAVSGGAGGATSGAGTLKVAGSAGNDGAETTGAAGGSGGSSPFGGAGGSGGVGGSTNTNKNGSAGTFPGGGGGGGAVDGGVGGNGAAGLVIVYW